MELELQPEDYILLKQVLERYIRDLRGEIAGTDKLSWRQEMHADEDRAKRLLEKLDEPTGATHADMQLHIVVRGFMLVG